jgi:hypothetical protein
MVSYDTFKEFEKLEATVLKLKKAVNMLLGFLAVVFISLFILAAGVISMERDFLSLQSQQILTVTRLSRGDYTCGADGCEKPIDVQLQLNTPSMFDCCGGACGRR